MSIALHTAIANLWNTTSLDSLFRGFWEDPASQASTLNEQSARPKQPFPYCIYDIDQGVTKSKMSGPTGKSKYEHRVHECRFTIHAQQRGARSDKEIATFLGDEVKKIFGGHPVVAPKEIAGVFQVSLLSELGSKTEAQNYSWMLRYSMETLVTVAY